MSKRHLLTATLAAAMALGAAPVFAGKHAKGKQGSSKDRRRKKVRRAIAKASRKANR